MVKDGTPGCRDAALHEHALKSRAAHTGFSAKLQFEILWSWVKDNESHVSRSFYGFMLRDKGRCLQVLWFEHGSANGKQSNTIIAAQLFESLRSHTVPMQYNL